MSTDTQGEGNFYIVGLGASAGGLEALQTFFDNMPHDSSMAFVVVQHLSPDYKSLMAELLSKHTRMNIRKIEDFTEVEPNCIYLNPPKVHVTLEKGKLRIHDFDSHRGLNLPIDTFFRSLAENQEERSIGIVLSGAGSDGTRGIRAIKEAGGMVMVQDGASAKFDGMPGTAIATGLADYIIPPQDMPAELHKFIRHPFVAGNPVEKPAAQEESDIYSKILALVRKQTGIDFSAYKPSTVNRRIERRIGICQLNDLDEYLHLLQQSSHEVEALQKDLLISVTKFFRDSDFFQRLKERVIPEIFKQAKTDCTLRVWVVGCATGEEAYSVAILLHEHMEESNSNFDIKIFATDVDRAALEFASAGIYSESIAADLPEGYLSKYFTKKDLNYQINRQIRDMVVFAPQNIIKDPPFTKINLITCRNMLIYLQPVLQRKVLSLFNFALVNKGFLFLGSSETTGEMHDCFEIFDQKAKIHQKQSNSATSFSDIMPTSGSRKDVLRPISRNSNRISIGDQASLEIQQNQVLYDKLLQEYVPTCLVIRENGDILHSFGKPQTFLNLPVGRMTINVLKMVPQSLSLAIATAINRALKEKKKLHYRNVDVRIDERSLVVNLSVEPITNHQGDILHLLLFLEETPQQEKQTSRDLSSEDFSLDNKAAQRIADLEQEVQFTKENLQATIEELQTSNEELQATNEELIASNEELQSTNEELESVNEELYTVNSELQSKIAELTQLNNDMDNLLRSSEIGTIFLDNELRIRKFTPAIIELISILPHDIGRPITDLAPGLIQNLEEESRQVMKSGRALTRPITTSSGQWFLLRISPYRNSLGRSEGVVINLVDINQLKETEQELQESRENLDSILQSLSVGVCVTNEKADIVRVNRTFCSLYGYEPGELTGNSIAMLTPDSMKEKVLQCFVQHIKQPDHCQSCHYPIRHKDGHEIKAVFNACFYERKNGERYQVAVITPAPKEN